MTLVLVIAIGCTRGDKGPDDVMSHTSSHTASPDVDADGDGFTALVDCDDQDASVHFGSDDPPGDGIDGDCDGGDGSGRSLTSFARFPPLGSPNREGLRLGHDLAVGDLVVGPGNEVVVGSYDLSVEDVGDGGIWTLRGERLEAVGSARGELLAGSGVLGREVAVLAYYQREQFDLKLY